MTNQLSEYEVSVIREGLAGAVRRLAIAIEQAIITDLPKATEIVGLIHEAINLLEEEE